MATYDERYVTTAQVQRELPFDANDFHLLDDAGFTVLLEGDTNTEGLLERESRRLEDWASTTWTTQQSTEALARPEHVSKLELPLPHRPIESVSSVTVNGDALAEADYHVLDTYLRVADDSTAIDAWPTAFQSVEVTWTHGFTEVPPEVVGGLIRLIRNALEQIETDGLSSESIGSASYSYRVPAAIKREVMAEVSPYAAPSYYGGVSLV